MVSAFSDSGLPAAQPRPECAPPTPTVIRAFAELGGVTVVVPPDVELEVRGIGVMGGFDHSQSGTGTPNAPRVVITGFAFWGGVSVERKVTKAERKRLKAERKERKQLDAEE